MNTSHLTADVVDAAFRTCFYQPDELPNDKTPPGAVVVKGIMATYGLHPGRLAALRPAVVRWIAQLPQEFLASQGGGWSFLNLCQRADGTQWTAMHLNMEQLCVLAIGLGLAQWLMPRDVWSVLPGGMPYIVFEPEIATAEAKRRREE